MEFKNNESKTLESDLPSIYLQLCLFIDAGLVFEKAIRYLVETNKKNNREIDIIFRYVLSNADKTNNSFENELYIVAQKIRSKELMRFALVLIDNSTKGVDLSSKFESEMHLMEEERLSLARSKAKKAETLLCFPLMLLLISIILICSAPAFMNM